MPAYLSYYLIAFAFNIIPTICGSELVFASGNHNAYEDYLARRIRLKFYKGSSLEKAFVSDISLQNVELIFSYIDKTKPLVLYIHGYSEDPSNESVRTIVGAHLKRGTDNIILVDWSDLSSGNYATVANRVRAIATILARTFDDLVLLSLDLEIIHVIGHSLGAQIAGLMGKISNNTIPRITGLDPAKPGFYRSGEDHIDADSARFVDIIHTDAGFYGASLRAGSVDFMANGGIRYQPGCPSIASFMSDKDFCSHSRAWRYYAESVLNERAFPAVQCSSYRKFLLGFCLLNRRVYFGYATSPDARGSFYFTTNAAPPYGDNAMTESSHRA